jgi:RNA polymerase sigma-70 factor (ECF subfamily)
VTPQRDFGVIYDEHVWRIYGFFAYRTRSRQDAEDLTQQTFERALGSWERYDERRAGVRSWLIVIARNLLTDHLRAVSARPRGAIGEQDLEALPALLKEPTVGLDPDLEQALAGLNLRERELVALRFGADLTGPEIAELTGLTLASVQQILSRALRRMRGVLDGSDLHRAVVNEPAGSPV